MNLKLIKKLIPKNLYYVIIKYYKSVFKIDKSFKYKTNKEIFNEVYLRGHWGNANNGKSISGSGSYDNKVIKPYISKIKGFLTNIKPLTIIDLGCGDFNIGYNFVKYCSFYKAYDVSTVIIQRNKKNYKNLKNVEFIFLDLVKDELPKGDIVFIRQVLQHLSNDHIKKFVNKINLYQPYKFLFLTEHIPFNDNFTPNLDKYAGPNIRIELNSGIELHKKPFNLIYKKYSVFLEVFEINGRIRTTLYEF